MQLLQTAACKKKPKSLTSAAHQTVPKQQVFHGGCPVQRGGIRVVNVKVHKIGHVVLQVFPHAWQVMHQRHLHLIQLLSGPNSRKQENLGRVHSSYKSNFEFLS